jgi:hypothetical protein
VAIQSEAQALTAWTLRLCIEDGIRMGLREIGWGVDRIQLAQDRGRWQSLVYGDEPARSGTTELLLLLAFQLCLFLYILCYFFSLYTLCLLVIGYLPIILIHFSVISTVVHFCTAIHDN